MDYEKFCKIFNLSRSVAVIHTIFNETKSKKAYLYGLK